MFRLSARFKINGYFTVIAACLEKISANLEKNYLPVCVGNRKIIIGKTIDWKIKSNQTKGFDSNIEISIKIIALLFVIPKNKL